MDNILNLVKNHYTKKSQSFSRKGVLLFLQKEANDAQCEIRVLNIGAGGNIGSLLKLVGEKKKWDLIELDLDLSRKPNICGNASQLPFRNSSFDLIFISEVIPQVPDVLKCTSELKRILAHQGALILTTRFLYPINDAPKDYFRFTEYGLRNIFYQFHIKEITPHLNIIQVIGNILLRSFYTKRMSPLHLMLPIYTIGSVLFQLGHLATINSNHGCSGYLLKATQRDNKHAQ